jgi:hypothetical protein
MAFAVLLAEGLACGKSVIVPFPPHYTSTYGSTGFCQSAAEAGHCATQTMLATVFSTGPNTTICLLDPSNGMPCGRVSAGAAQAGAPGRTTPGWPPPPVARFAACARPASQRRSRLSFQSMPCSRVSAGASQAGAPGRSTPGWPPPPAARFAACARPASTRRSRLSFHGL